MTTFKYGQLLVPTNGLRLIERKAQRCLSYCRHKLGLHEIPLPIPVDEWIETALDISFAVDDLSHLGNNVQGISHIREREIVISDLIKDPGRFRFISAHSLGHFVLHADKHDRFHEKQEPGFGAAKRLERHADRFAAAFLMPIPLFERELVASLQNARLDPTAKIAELMTPTHPSGELWRDVVFPHLRRRFVVSQVALAIRCRGLRLTNDPHRPLLPARFFYDVMSALYTEHVLSPMAESEFVEPVPHVYDDEAE